MMTLSEEETEVYHKALPLFLSSERYIRRSELKTIIGPTRVADMELMLKALEFDEEYSGHQVPEQSFRSCKCIVALILSYPFSKADWKEIVEALGIEEKALRLMRRDLREKAGQPRGGEGGTSYFLYDLE